MAVCDNRVRVYNKQMSLLAIFEAPSGVIDDEAKKNLMVAPTVHRETNGESTLSFQMLVNSEKWQLIKDPENIYTLNGHHYTALNDSAYQFTGESGVRVVNVTLVETWYLLDKKYTQAYNCGIYCYAKATFSGYTTDGAVFTINSSGCSNPSNTISNALAWNQVKLWSPKDDKGNDLTYYVLTSDEHKPTGWENAPAGVFFTNFSVSGNSATVTIRTRNKIQTQKSFEYSGNSYSIDSRPYPASIDSVYVNSTVETKETGDERQTYTRYTSSNKPAGYRYSNGTVTLTYSPSSNETINSVIITYGYYDLGNISIGATCTFAYGAEVVDEHTFVILPKSNPKYKLTVNGVEYDDGQVKDSRGALMPRGSGGYALWAALKGTGWSLGVCDVIAKEFDASIDYGCFNVESDMKDVLYNIRYIQELYGGILDFDSENKVVNYRAENSEDYQAYNDGFNAWTGYEFREGKNMIDQPQVTSDNELITRAYLLGYGGLNVKKVNGGKTYIDDFSYTSDVYEGYLKQTLIYDTLDDGGMNQLLYWGRKELSKMCKPRKKLSFSVTDIRTTEGYEHEVFDLNDIVRCYYKDTETGEETYEEKRITLWEYDAFAMWDCTVEIGDKTQNFTETFKLIYNTAIKQAPHTNASGQISADEVSIEFEDYNSMDDFFSDLSRIEEDNYRSITDIIVKTNELYAKIDLFAQFQKVTEGIITDTYAGLALYADSESASAKLLASVTTGPNGERVKSLSEIVAYADTNGAYSSMLADFKKNGLTTTSKLVSYVDANSAYSSMLASFKTAGITSASTLVTYADRNSAYYSMLNSFQTNGITSASSLVSYADANSAYHNMLASFTTAGITTAASITTYVDKNSSYASMLSSFKNAGITSTSGLETWANNKYASASLSSTVQFLNDDLYNTKQNLTTSIADVKTWATEKFATVELVSSYDNKVARITISSSGASSTIRLDTPSGTSGAYLSISGSATGGASLVGRSITLSGNSVQVGVSASNTSVTLNGTVRFVNSSVTWGTSQSISLKTTTIAGTTINYLGY